MSTITKGKDAPPVKKDTSTNIHGVPEGAAHEESHGGYGGTDRLQSEIGPLVDEKNRKQASSPFLKKDQKTFVCLGGAMSDTTKRQTEDEDLDEALEDTFPASDPPAVGGTTGPDDRKPS